MKIRLAVAGCLLLVLSVWADTLEMRDGRVLSGKYVGGTAASIRFEVNGEVQLFRVSDVLALTFADLAAPGNTRRRPQSPPPTLSVPSEPPARSSYPPSSRDSVTIPAGTRLVVRMIDGVDSNTNRVGDRFQASLAEDLSVDGMVVAPKGTDVYGRLVRVREAGSVSGKSQLTLELTEIRINGELQPLYSSDYDVSGGSRTADSARKIGGAAAIGAVIGAIAGGGKGAAIGAGVGAGAGTAVQVMTKGERVRVPSETLLEFRLDQPVTIRNVRDAR